MSRKRKICECKMQVEKHSGIEELPVKNMGRADIPDMCIPLQDRSLALAEEPDKALLQWKPTEMLSDDQIEAYVSMAKGIFKYGEEQSLGVLMWHGYNREKAMEDLPNYNLPSYEWTDIEKALFEQVLDKWGENFEELKKALPKKPKAELIRYFFKRKATIRHELLRKKEDTSNQVDRPFPVPGCSEGVFSNDLHNILGVMERNLKIKRM